MATSRPSGPEGRAKMALSDNLRATASGAPVSVWNIEDHNSGNILCIGYTECLLDEGDGCQEDLRQQPALAGEKKDAGIPLLPAAATITTPWAAQALAKSSMAGSLPPPKLMLAMRIVCELSKTMEKA